jgi:glycine hydroxymethyltransferase
MMAPKQHKELAYSIKSLVKEHHKWRQGCINILAAENVSSPAVREIVASDLMHRYSEYEGHDIEKRWDEGGRYIVEIEKIAEGAARKLFNSKHVDLRPVSGHVAIASVILSMVGAGGKSLELKGSNGGHEWYYIARNLKPVSYTADWLPFDTEEWNIDVDGARRKIRESKPDLIILGSSFYLFPHPTSEIREVADEVASTVVYDGAHVLGLIAGKQWPNPLDKGAHILTGSTHKSFPGPQKGIVLSNDGEKLQQVRTSLYPSMLTNHHLMNVAALGYAMLEFMDFGEAYSKQVVRNAKALAEALHQNGLDVIGEKNGYTRSHQVLVRTAPAMQGAEAAKLLDRANVICNKMELENAEGLRIGTSEATRVGMKESEMKEIAKFISDVVVSRKDPPSIARRVRAFMKDYSRVEYSYERGKNPYAFPLSPV